jgi:hypothetical protein
MAASVSFFYRRAWMWSSARCVFVEKSTLD